MKKTNLLFIIIIGLIIYSCSSNDDTEDQIDDSFKSAFLDLSWTFDGGCYSSLHLTNGTGYIDSVNGVTLTSSFTKYIIFTDIRLDNCELNSPSTKIWDLENGLESELNSMFRPQITYHNSVITHDASEMIYAELIVNDTGVSFQIEFENGETLSDNYIGTVENVTTN